MATNHAAHWRCPKGSIMVHQRLIGSSPWVAPMPPTDPSRLAGLSSFPVSRMVFRRTSHLREGNSDAEKCPLEDHNHTFLTSEPDMNCNVPQYKSEAKSWNPPILVISWNLPPVTHHKNTTHFLQSCFAVCISG